MRNYSTLRIKEAFLFVLIYVTVTNDSLKLLFSFCSLQLTSDLSSYALCSFNIKTIRLNNEQIQQLLNLNKKDYLYMIKIKL